MQVDSPITSDVRFFAFLLTYGDPPSGALSDKFALFVSNGMHNKLLVGAINSATLSRIMRLAVQDLGALELLENYAEKARRLRDEMLIAL